MAAVRKLRAGNDFRFAHRNDSEAVLIGDVDELAVGFDDVAFVDADLLSVGPVVVDTDSPFVSGRGLGGIEVAGGFLGPLLEKYVVCVVITLATEPPRGDAGGRFGLHVVE